MEMLKTTGGFFEWGKLHYFAGYPTSLVGYALVLSIYVRYISRCNFNRLQKNTIHPAACIINENLLSGAGMQTV